MTPHVSRPLLTRVMFGAAAAIAIAALALHASAWLRTGVFDWPVAINISGLLVLMVTGAFDPPPGTVRNGLTVLALAMILPSAAWLFLR